MIVRETSIAGLFTIDIERREDQRGFFARTYCDQEFRENGLKPTSVQSSISFNAKRGTLRGLHFQYVPAAECKYVRCTRGAVFDVVVDLRPESATFLEHFALTLSAESGRGIYIPERFAHGFITLEDRTEVAYMMSEAYAPGFEGGIPYDDPILGIEWPRDAEVISDRDLAWKPLASAEAELTRRMSVVVRTA